MTEAGAPAVTVVIPTCNRKDYIERCIESLAAQTCESYEVIVVDDASTDDTPEYLDSVSEQHPDLQFRWERNESNRGANPSRNRGVQIARAPLIAFLDSDCQADPNWLVELIAVFTDERVAAAQGCVEDVRVDNIWERTLAGTHRVTGRFARRLTGGNMCVRRELLLEHGWDEDRGGRKLPPGETPDTTVSGRGDEEGLYLRLRHAGYQILCAEGAVVHHDHPYTVQSFFRQAYRGGGSAARFVYKYALPQRLDMLPFLLTYVTLPLGFLNPWLWAVPLFFFSGALAAITYNDLFRKGKAWTEVLITFPALLAYYHVRLVGYLKETLRLRLTRHEVKRTPLSSP